MDSNQRSHSNFNKFSDSNLETNDNLNVILAEREIDIYKINDEFYNGKKYIAIKLPAKIENVNKAIELLGGYEIINKKVIFIFI